VSVPRFRLITEADARTLEPGTTVELDAGGHVTPLARDTLRERRITVVPTGTTDPELPDDLAPATPVGRVGIGTDHTGLDLRTALVAHLRGSGRSVVDVGTDSAARVDYPDIAGQVARLVARGEVDAGIVIDGSGIGSAVAANKVRGVRAAMCATPTLARDARAYTGTNVLTLGSTLVRPEEAVEIVDVWLSTAMTGPRYVRRLLKVRALEDRF